MGVSTHTGTPEHPARARARTKEGLSGDSVCPNPSRTWAAAATTATVMVLFDRRRGAAAATVAAAAAWTEVRINVS